MLAHQLCLANGCHCDCIIEPQYQLCLLKTVPAEWLKYSEREYYQSQSGSSWPTDSAWHFLVLFLRHRRTDTRKKCSLDLRILTSLGVVTNHRTSDHNPFNSISSWRAGKLNYSIKTLSQSARRYRDCFILSWWNIQEREDKDGSPSPPPPPSACQGLSSSQVNTISHHISSTWALLAKLRPKSGLKW